ncbi:AAA family ATPase [Pseudomonas alloputida]|uniref:DNA binding domain-containing protein n=2 Tax=Pseudomonas TaxID=286 RepID=A0AAJ5V0X0_9PSED|nr:MULTISPECIES: RNA-binding domain-containing protein [Pseudomonas]MDP9523418.1 putative DNA binding domain-containing protein [Pseudomonas putida]QOH71660.1 putative DNA binding domain-containing protein [Pseudomonas putida]TRZ63008.1 AAA family ATPase [Pseudomonas alloputida]WEA19955.1 putative DNA binding domain-containing protein [Pseudomonas juntendi]HEN8733362.1 putative DNA binding domain-containing protein [Pseudomonas putida]
MTSVSAQEELGELTESLVLECKLAQGKDGRGELPKDFWPTYSAFANTRGGTVLLGVSEKNGEFRVEGILDVEKVRKDLFSTLNDRGKVNVNLLNDSDVTTISIDGKTLVKISIPAATRKSKPVFLNGNPLSNTYRRLNEGDVRLDDESVRRMLAEQVEDERDNKILLGFGIEDIDPESLRIYRQMLKDEKPGHPYLEEDDLGLLRCLRGFREDRQSGNSGLTIAGLLMFGKWHAIQEAMPNYFVDYQERPEAKTELRWVDRIVPDGTWTGNIFDFYRRVYRKLVTDLKVPFAVKDGQRQEDTPVHVALREALVNTLVHADYTGRVSILVVKRPDMFGFRNPGNSRLPLEQVLRGGESDCRNRILHQLFLLIGLGERAGSGIPKIYSGWKSLHWRPPALYEKVEPDQTLLELRMVDLVPKEVVAKLQAVFGSAFSALGPTERMILATAAVERVVSHTRLVDICGVHPHDLTMALKGLVKGEMLVSGGRSRGMVYHLPGELLPTPEQVFAEPAPGMIPDEIEEVWSEHTAPEHSELSSEYSEVSSEYSDAERDANGCLMSSHLDAPLVDSLEKLSPAFRAYLENLAAEPRAKQRLSKDIMVAAITAICNDQFVTLTALAKLVNRHPDGLRQQHLSTMVRNRQVRLAFPTKPTHEKQAYRTVCALNDD